jgi:hypothetical protein
MVWYLYDRGFPRKWTTLSVNIGDENGNGHVVNYCIRYENERWKLGKEVWCDQVHCLGD